MMLANIYLWGVAGLGVGALLGYWLLRWKERNVRAVCALKEQTLLENARREAETICREARLLASEEGVKVRAQLEQALTTQRLELTGREARLAERETLINRQLENLVQEESHLRQQQQEWQKKAEALDL